MHSAFICNGVGTFLLVTALVLHIVCLSMPYYSEANFDDFGMEVSRLVQSDPTQLGLSKDASPEELQNAIENLAVHSYGSLNFGMWKLCMDSEQVTRCVHWSRETTYEDSSGFLLTLKAGEWIRGVQAMALLGLIFLVLAVGLAVLNVVIKSKGDRLRFFYLFILGFCLISATFILIGDIIMGAKHREAFDPVLAQNNNSPPRQLYHLFTKRFTLSWGFVLDIISVALILLSGAAHFVGGRIAKTSNGVV
ncbi:hypothetical protein PoB_005904800 [Plakobranchus ocellatus]|uniref:Uncharacterized protein n=1 Tax=Plakobranchus ocellatus TaxID=259542 RepID=A0AAV4CKK5_9GAST|nr:hypothetical protein PoB_005904800 [Plakobranchus ocellatus]